MQNIALATITRFLGDIGLPVRTAELTEPTFLPGTTIVGGEVVYDPSRLTYPGDLLHESGHLAFTPAAARPRVCAATEFDLGDDFAAIAWSYAAAVHLELDLPILFHEGGYRGWSGAYIENFTAGRYVGVPMLQWAGLAVETEYPRMIKWVRD